MVNHLLITKIYAREFIIRYYPVKSGTGDNSKVNRLKDSSHKRQ